MSDKIYIKNMVCDRCILVIQQILQEIKIKYSEISLGEVTLHKPISDGQLEDFASKISEVGFAVIDDKKNRTIAQIKNIIIDLVQKHDGELKINLSELLSENLNLEYNYLSNLFSEIENSTIEKYFIAQKIEKVKELLSYNELSLSEIAFRLNYSSVAYLSNQFKKITGYTTGQFKKKGIRERKPIDGV